MQLLVDSVMEQIVRATGVLPPITLGEGKERWSGTKNYQPRIQGGFCHPMNGADAFVDVVKTKGSGWVDYKFPNPKTNKVEQKTSYVEGLDGWILGCGIYK